MQPKKTIREVNSLQDIVKPKSSRAQERKAYLDQVKSRGCDLCGGHARLAFYPKNPKQGRPNLQQKWLMDFAELEKELKIQVLICVSCRMRMLGEHRAPFAIKNKELFYELRKAYYVPPAKFEGKTSKSSQKRRA